MELGMNTKKLGFGLMRLPQTDGEINMEETKKMVDYCMKHGFNYFDTAYPYHGGKSESAVKEVITKRYERASYYLTTKLPIWNVKNREDMERIFEEQLERTGAGYFDIYLLHAMDREKAEFCDENGVWEFVRELKEKGKIKHLGFSFHDTAQVLDEILTAHPEAEVVQLQINYCDWDDTIIQSGLCYETARKHGKPVLIMEPVKGGTLARLAPSLEEMLKETDKKASIASWAIRYAASLDGVLTVLSGMSDMEQLEDNVSYMKEFKPLTDQERKTLKAMTDELKKLPQIPCTSCRYCVEGCPQQINIPSLFGKYNHCQVFHDRERLKKEYESQTKDSGRASACIACGQCEAKCPQHLSVIEHLKAVAGMFE